MTRRSPLTSPAVAGAVVLAVGLVSIASAQSEGRLGGKTVAITLGQSLRYSDNLDLDPPPTDSVLQSVTSLGVAVNSITRTQSFQLGFGGAFEADTDGDTDFADPYLRMSYALEGANSRLSASANYTRFDIDDAFTQSTPISTDPDDPVSGTARIEDGIRTDRGYSLGFETGLRSPLGFRLDLASRSRRYSDTTNAGLYDTDTRSADALVRFRIDPAVTARATASWRHYEAEDSDQTDRRETSYGVGLAVALSPTLSLDASLRQQNIETRRLSGTRETDGLAYGLDLTRSLRNGLVAVSFDSQPTLNDRRHTLRATRSMSLRRDGTLSYGIGLTKTEGLSTDPLFSLAYVQPLKRSNLSIDFSQEARTDEEDDAAVILTRLGASYNMELTETLTWSLGASLSDVDARQATGEDRRRLDLRSTVSGQLTATSTWSAGLSLSDTESSDAAGSDNERRFGIQLAYRHALAQDWDMVARYEHTRITETTTPDRRSNAISIGLEKSFAFRP